MTIVTGNVRTTALAVGAGSPLTQVEGDQLQVKEMLLPLGDGPLCSGEERPDLTL